MVRTTARPETVPTSSLTHPSAKDGASGEKPLGWNPMHVKLRARLMGETSFCFGDHPVRPGSRKGVALLAYLVLAGSGVRRAALAETLWAPGKLVSVHQALYQLRKLPGADSWLREAGDLVWVEADSDVADFELALERGESAAALAAYGGDLLGAVPEPGALAYQSWLAQLRSRLGEMRLAALKLETARLEAAGQLDEAYASARHVLTLDALDESSYRTCMRLAYALVDAATAKAWHLRCLAALREELGSEPSPETQALALAIERGEPLHVPVDLAALPTERLMVLQALAAAEGALGVKGLAAVLGRQDFDVAADLALLEHHGLVDAHLSLSPRHADAIEASISASAKQALHQRVAAVLTADPDADDAVVAAQLLGAGDVDGGAARFVAAAKVAIDGAALDLAAARLFRACWAAHGSPSLRLEATMLLEGVAAQRGDEALQEACLLEAEELALATRDDRQLAEVKLRRSRQRLAQGQLVEGLELALGALRIAQDLGDADQLARARNAVGGARYFAGDLDGAAEAFGANLGAEDPVERYRAHNNLGSLAAMRGASEEAYGQFESALTLARAIGPKVDVAATLNNLAATAERIGDYPRAVRHFKEGIDVARRNQAADREGRMLANLAIVYARQGQLGPAWNTAEEVEEVAGRLSAPRLRLSAIELEADIQRLCGMLEPAMTTMQTALAIAKDIGDQRKVLSLTAQRMTIESVASGELRRAEDALAALEAERLTDVVHWLWLELSLAARDADEAVAYWSRAQADDRSAHHRLVADIAAVRAGLLASLGRSPGAGRAMSADVGLVDWAREAAARLAENATEAGSLDGNGIVERPLGRLLLALRQASTEAGGPVPRHGGHRLLPHGFEVPAAVTDEVDEQAMGLPRAMAEQLRQQPKRWLAALDV